MLVPHSPKIWISVWKNRHNAFANYSMICNFGFFSSLLKILKASNSSALVHCWLILKQKCKLNQVMFFKWFFKHFMFIKCWVMNKNLNDLFPLMNFYLNLVTWSSLSVLCGKICLSIQNVHLNLISISSWCLPSVGIDF